MSGAPTTPVTLSLTAIRVTDLARSAEFYTAGCGFAEENAFSTDTFDAVILRAGTAGVELIAPHGDPAPPDHGTMFTKLVLNTDDVAGLLAAACARGGTEEMPATTLARFGGRTVGMVRDPDGYLLEFVSPTAQQPAR
ncbi:VOC family protein [Nocardia beijingensis]|uniref:VOC family protein n=1 Tax=Nocardia beijingensis TaxID=95162 RepID=UPI001893C1D4|nr:VOC family protein [Nocardia beijingensis]MBF6079543.1 VOC family protein [Nocardia beijingensis]